VIPGEATAQCIGCGCTHFKPCPGGCRWSALNPETNEGLCSACAERPLDELMANLGFSRMTEQEATIGLFQNATA